MLVLDEVGVRYGKVPALHAVSLRVEEGEIVALLGANGAGKTTTLKAISGLVPLAGGRIMLKGTEISGLAPHRIVAHGIAHVPEGRRVLGNLTVEENLVLASWVRRDRSGARRDIARMFDLFPLLAERRHRRAETLSGGEQQMLAVARALVTRGALLVLDEPSMGLAPLVVRTIYNVLREIHAQGTTLLLVEQNAHLALTLAHRAYLLEVGRVVLSGTADEMRGHPRMVEAYLGP